MLSKSSFEYVFLGLEICPWTGFDVIASVLLLPVDEALIGELCQ